MSRYIDVEALLNRLPDDLPYKASVKRVLMQAPTADVVDVVRCRDCKHYRGENIGLCTRLWVDCMDTEDYCSYGERKENGN